MNKVILIGNVGREPNVRYVDNGVCVAQVVMATSERGYTLQNGTQVPERTEWHNLVFWKGIAERVERYVHKSTKICVEGKLRTRTYETRDHQMRTITEVVVENMEILSPIHRDNNYNGAYNNGYNTNVEDSATEQVVEQPDTVQTGQGAEEAPF